MKKQSPRNLFVAAALLAVAAESAWSEEATSSEPAAPAELPEKLYYSISEVAAHSGVKAHVLRYWEQEFPTLKPKKNRAGNRSYRRKDIDEILRIQDYILELADAHGVPIVENVSFDRSVLSIIRYVTESVAKADHADAPPAG